VKVADFGFCKALEGKEQMTKTMVGSPIYMAPEILKGYIVKYIKITKFLSLI
jgi:serine/threonine-protein kinase ULK/ATG1